MHAVRGFISSIFSENEVCEQQQQQEVVQDW